MFTRQQKMEISQKVQEILRQIPNGELPDGEIEFILHVDGKEYWSWANIRNMSSVSNPVPDAIIQNLTAK